MKRILIDSYAGNTLAALCGDEGLLEFQMEKNGSRIVVGSIYKGKVENVVSGMQAAFVNIGLEKNGYLFMGESQTGLQFESEVKLPPVPDIKVGDEIIVQVVKDVSGTKGVRLTTHVTFAERNLVYVPDYDSVVVSRKIESEKVRRTLTEKVEKIMPSVGGFIVRTVAETAPDEVFFEEAQYLESLYKEVLSKAENATAPTLLYEEGNLAKRMLRDVYTPDVDEIVVADLTLFNDVTDVAIRRGGALKQKLKFYNGPIDVFAKYGLLGEIDGILRNKVSLSSGAYINIDKTEALTAIDVNTGKYIGEDSLEKTVFETNLMAADEIARQLRLRNIGGIVIIDFIDMEEQAHRDAVLDRLKTALKQDRSRCNVLGMTGLGLVELTRKKKRKESSSTLVKNCPYCKGDGVIFSNDYIVMKLRCALLDLFAENYRNAIVDLNADICDFILATGALSRDVAKIWRDKRIYLIPHNTYHQEFFLVRGDNQKVIELPDKAKLLY